MRRPRRPVGPDQAPEGTGLRPLRDGDESSRAADSNARRERRRILVVVGVLLLLALAALVVTWSIRNRWMNDDLSDPYGVSHVHGLGDC